MKVKMLFTRFSFFLILFHGIFSVKQGFDLDTSDWIDPGNTFGVLSNTNTNSNDHDSETSYSENTEISRGKSNPYEYYFCNGTIIKRCGNCMYYKKKLKLENKSLKTAISMMREKHPDYFVTKTVSWKTLFDLIERPDCPEKILLKSFLSIILMEFRKWDTEDLIISVHMSSDNLKLIREAVDGQRKVVTISDILFGILDNVSMPQSHLPSLQSATDIVEFLTQGKMLIFILIFLVFAWLLHIKLTGMSALRAIFVTFVFLCFASIFWGWIHLYKKAMVKKNYVIANYGSRCSCKTTDESWWTYLSSFFVVKEDNCLEYVNAIHVEPIWEVSFLTAVSETFSKFVSQPWENLGHGLSDFIKVVFISLPYHLAIPATIAFGMFTIVIVFVFMSFLFNYRVRLPWIGVVAEPDTCWRNVCRCDRVMVEELTQSSDCKLCIVNQSQRRALCSRYPNKGVQAIVSAKYKSVQTSVTVVNVSTQTECDGATLPHIRDINLRETNDECSSLSTSSAALELESNFNMYSYVEDIYVDCSDQFME